MKSFFTKSKYSIDDIDTLITNKTQESYNLEFKSVRELLKLTKTSTEFTKDISAFANSAGGIIIYGIEEIERVAKSKSYVNGYEISKEFLENIIHGNIHRRINVRIYPIVDPDISCTIYLIKIPASENAPHQNSDKLYYRRDNFRTSKMEEYDVRNRYLGNKITKLRLLKPKYSPENVEVSGIKIKVAKFIINFSIENYGDILELHSKLTLKIPYAVINKYKTNINNQQIYKYWNQTDAGYEIFVIPIEQVIFAEEKLNISKCLIQITYNEMPIIKELPLTATLAYSHGNHKKSFQLLDAIVFLDKKLGSWEFENLNW